MKERPILFSAPMVRALLAGTKTQTRRVVKGLNENMWVEETANGGFNVCYDGEPCCGTGVWEVSEHVHPIACPYGKPGDRLWVRENFSGPNCMEKSEEFPSVPPGQWPKESSIWYWADGEPTHGDWTRPRPSIHMPRWASRITLEVTGVRVERLQDISEADAIAEGVRNSLHLPSGRFARENYEHLWWTINGDGSWEANPWVWVVEFKKAPGETA